MKLEKNREGTNGKTKRLAYPPAVPRRIVLDRGIWHHPGWPTVSCTEA